jgi:hypothetical protein
MARAPLKFRQCDVERARRAAIATGGGDVVITRAGNIVIRPPVDDNDNVPLEKGVNEWDE